MHTILNAFRVMAGLLEMVAIVIKGNGLRILVLMPRPVNTYCFIVQKMVKTLHFQCSDFQFLKMFG